MKLRKMCLAECHSLKDLNDFHVNRSQPDGRHYYCKECQKRRAKKYRDANLEVCRERTRKSSRHQHLKRMYGITVAEYEALVVAQDGVCPICLKPLKRPSVDHCHETGHVRGVLCRHCNSGLSMFETDPEAVLRLITYLGLTTRLGSTKKAQSRRRSEG